MLLFSLFSDLSASSSSILILSRDRGDREERDTGDTASCFMDAACGGGCAIGFCTAGGRSDGGGREVRGGWSNVIKVVEVVEVCGRWW